MATVTVTYAQNFEDVLLNRIFEGKRMGFYVDVGAAHPEFLSVTKHFYDMGWRGINIDPNINFYSLLQQRRPRDVNLCMAAGAQFEVRDFFQSASGGEFSSFLREYAQSPGAEAPEVYKAEVRTLAEICRQFCDAPIDFLKIDVEGFEREVLEGADFEIFRPVVVVIESTKPCGGLNWRTTDTQKNSSEWEMLLTGNGYHLAYHDGLSDYFIRQENPELDAAFSIPINPYEFIFPSDWTLPITEMQLLPPAHAEQYRHQLEADELRERLIDEKKQLEEHLANEKRMLEEQLTNEKGKFEEQLTSEKRRSEEQLTNEKIRLNAQLASEKKRLEEQSINDKNQVEDRLANEKKQLEERLTIEKRQVEDQLKLANQRISELESWLDQARRHGDLRAAILREEIYRRSTSIFGRLFWPLRGIRTLQAEPSWAPPITTIAQNTTAPVPVSTEPSQGTVQPLETSEPVSVIPLPPEPELPQIDSVRQPEVIVPVETSEPVSVIPLPPESELPQIDSVRQPEVIVPDHMALRLEFPRNPDVGAALMSFSHENNLTVVDQIELALTDRKTNPAAVWGMEPWFGIARVAPYTPAWYLDALMWRPKAVFSGPSWESVAVSCQGVAAFSADHAAALAKIITAPVTNLVHPVSTSSAEWSPESFKQRERPRLIQAGWWFRCPHAIYMFPGKLFEKVWIADFDDSRAEALLAAEAGALGREFRTPMLKTAHFESVCSAPEAIDPWFVDSLFFLHLYDASVDWVVLECLSRGAPLLVNQLPSVREYLGVEYPLYYSCYSEAEEKAADFDLLLRAHDYLRQRRERPEFRLEAFAEKLRCLFPEITA